MSKAVDTYIEQSDMWPEVMTALRPILLDCGLSEDLKWNKPCYSHADSNIVIMQEMKDHLSLMFFKGVLLEDPEEVLHEQGPNSRSAMRMKFTDAGEVTSLETTIRAYVQEAIDVEEAGLEVPPAPEPEWVDELQTRLDEDDDLRTAFEALTPGRQREYNLYFSDAKQAETRERRIEKYAPKILEGKGFRDR